MQVSMYPGKKKLLTIGARTIHYIVLTFQSSSVHKFLSIHPFCEISLETIFNISKSDISLEVLSRSPCFWIQVPGCFTIDSNWKLDRSGTWGEKLFPEVLPFKNFLNCFTKVGKWVMIFLEKVRSKIQF